MIESRSITAIRLLLSEDYGQHVTTVLSALRDNLSEGGRLVRDDIDTQPKEDQYQHNEEAIA